MLNEVKDLIKLTKLEDSFEGLVAPEPESTPIDQMSLFELYQQELIHTDNSKFTERIEAHHQTQFLKEYLTIALNSDLSQDKLERALKIAESRFTLNPLILAKFRNLTSIPSPDPITTENTEARLLDI